MNEYDSDNAIYWRRKFGKEMNANDALRAENAELKAKIEAVEREVGKMNAVLTQTDKNPHTCELVWR